MLISIKKFEYHPSILEIKKQVPSDVTFPLRGLRIRDTCCNDNEALSKSQKSQKVFASEIFKVTKFTLGDDPKMVEIAREIDLLTIFTSNLHC